MIVFLFFFLLFKKIKKKKKQSSLLRVRLVDRRRDVDARAARVVNDLREVLRRQGALGGELLGRCCGGGHDFFSCPLV